MEGKLIVHEYLWLIQMNNCFFKLIHVRLVIKSDDEIKVAIRYNSKTEWMGLFSEKLLLSQLYKKLSNFTKLGMYRHWNDVQCSGIITPIKTLCKRLIIPNTVSLNCSKNWIWNSHLLICPRHNTENIEPLWLYNISWKEHQWYNVSPLNISYGFKQN